MTNTILQPQQGGAGVANSANNTITFTGNYTFGITLTGNTGLTYPTSGTLATLAGTEALTGKTINGLTITSTSSGVLTIANSSSLITSGAYSITLTATGTTAITLPTTGTVVSTGVVSSFTQQQNFAASAITSTSNSIAWDLNTAQFATHTFTEDTTLANPTNMVNGGTYVLKLTQHASSPKTLAYGNAYKWPGGTAFTVTASNSAVDVITCISDGSSMFCVGQAAFA